MPVERLRRHRPTPSVEVLRGRQATEALAQLAQQAEELVASSEAPRHQARLALGVVPAAEVLDYRLRVHGRRSVGGELAHRRRAAQSLGTAPKLVQDLRVAVALADPGLEGRESLRIDRLEGAV